MQDAFGLALNHLFWARLNRPKAWLRRATTWPVKAQKSERVAICTSDIFGSKMQQVSSPKRGPNDGSESKDLEGILGTVPALNARSTLKASGPV